MEILLSGMKIEKSCWKDKIKAKIEEYDKQIKQLEKDDVGKSWIYFRMWSDLKAKKSVLQELLEER